MEARTRPLKPGDPDQCGRFKLIARLGAGGMGVAYLAETAEGLFAVVKMVQLELADDPDARRRFRQEVLASLAVETPFVPEILASDVSAERQWVAIEFIDGPTLAELVSREGPLARNQQYALASALAEGLAQLHARGLVHRDVKPANIICTTRGPRLIDFGIAIRESVKGVTRTGSLSPGSPGWMAPEQLDPFAEPTSAIDVFAWGCVCWFAAAGKSPFAGATSKESFNRLRSWTPTAARVPAALNPGLTAAVIKALSNQPSRRNSAARIASELGGAGGVTSGLVATTWDPTAGTAEMSDPTWLGTRLNPREHLESTRRRGGVLIVGAIVLGCLVAAVILGSSTLLRPESSGKTATGLGASRGNSPSRALSTPTQSTSTASKPSSPAGELTPESSPTSTASKPSSPAGVPTPKSSPSRASTNQPSAPPFPGYGGSRRVGYGAIKLGMTRAQLEATGETTGYSSETGDTCIRYTMRAGGYAFFSQTQRRVVAIEFVGKMATSRGIRIDSTAEQVWAAYPEAPGDRYGHMFPEVASGVFYTIGTMDGRVELLVLQSERQDCGA